MHAHLDLEPRHIAFDSRDVASGLCEPLLERAQAAIDLVEPPLEVAPEAVDLGPQLGKAALVGRERGRGVPGLPVRDPRLRNAS